MTDPTSKILSHAIDYIASHKEALDAYRNRRLHVCQEASSPEPEVGDGGVEACYLRAGYDDWCESCLAREPHHAAYISAKKRRALAARRLQSIARDR